MKRRSTYIATPRGEKVGLFLIALGYCGFLILSGIIGAQWH